LACLKAIHDLQVVACLLALPNNATIAELLVDMRYKGTLWPG
jgi:hypothetical protein